MRGRATIEDVARLAGVSIATVSRALHRPQVVSAATRDSVLEAVRATGYTQNTAAQSLRLRRAGSVLVLVPDIGNPFFADLLAGIETTATAAGYTILIGDTRGDVERERSLLRHLRNGRADGVLLLSGHLPEETARLLAAPHPARPRIVAISERLEGVETPHVVVDNVDAAKAATAHLIALGHRRIAHVTGPATNVLTRDRLDGWQEALREAGLPLRPGHVLAGDFTIGSGHAAARRLLGLAPRPTAVFCANDEMAMGLIAELHAAGVPVPGTVSVVGFDDIAFSASFIPPITTVHQPRRRIGERAMGLLLDTLAGAAGAANRQVTLETRLVVRGSTAPPG